MGSAGGDQLEARRRRDLALTEPRPRAPSEPPEERSEVTLVDLQPPTATWSRR